MYTKYTSLYTLCQHMYTNFNNQNTTKTLPPLGEKKKQISHNVSKPDMPCYVM